MQPGRFCLLLLALLVGACTMRSALDAMTSPEDRAFGQAMVDHLRTGDDAWLRERFDPDLWEQSAKELTQTPNLFPTRPEATELVGFESSAFTRNGVTERNKTFTLVTHGGGRWTVTRFGTRSSGGSDQVFEWNVVPHSSVPPELAFVQGFDAMVPWLRAGAIAILLLAGGLIFWLVRRSRRKVVREYLGQGSGTP